MNIDNLNQYMSVKRSKLRFRNTDRVNFYTRATIPRGVILSNILSKLDPLSDQEVKISGTWDLVPTGTCSLYQIWMEIDYNATHFWYKSIYKLITESFEWGQGRSEEPSASLEQYYEKYCGELYGNFCNRPTSDSWRRPSRTLFNQESGDVYLLVSGGGPIDGISVGDISTIDAMIDDFMERRVRESAIIYDRLHRDLQVSDAHLPLAMTNFFDKEVPATLCNAARKFSENKKFSMIGESLIQPTGSQGYIEAEVILSKSNLNKLLKKLEWDDDALISKVMQYTSRHNPYLGWIPDDLTDVLFTTDKFSMVRVDKEPRPIFSSKMMDRYLDKRFDFSACVSLLYNSKKYSVEPGVYFMKIDNIEQLSMIDYDIEISKILEDITLLAVSSRSQAIINSSENVVSDKIKTSITARELSKSTGDDSGFIARPTARRLGL